MNHDDPLNDRPRPRINRRKLDRALVSTELPASHPDEAANEENDPAFLMRGDHCVTLYISYEAKSRLKRLAERYDRSAADMMRAVLKVGIPMMEGLSQAEEIMVKEYIELFRRLRQVKSLKEV